MPKYRKELKYLLPNTKLAMLKHRLNNVMKLDKNTPVNGKYLIHSLYFDDYHNSASFTTHLKTAKRFKWRIRYYGDDLSLIKLEKKVKINGYGYKQSCLLTIEEYQKIISFDIFELVYDTKKDLIKELIKDMMIYNYKPVVMIDYERVAYVEEITNVRITLDLNITASYEIDKFLNGNYQQFHLNRNAINLLEVKYDYILPSYIKKIVESYDFYRTAFSKYYTGRKVLDAYIK